MPRTYAELELEIAECSEWADTHILEAFAEEAFDAACSDLVDVPDLCFPYGRDFGAVDMRSSR